MRLVCAKIAVMVQETIQEIVSKFLARGGKINSYYLSGNARNKQTLVYLRGWFSGHNIREAISKAISGK